MGKGNNPRLWAMFLVTVMVTSTLIGFSAMVVGNNAASDGLDILPISNERIEQSYFDTFGRQPVNMNAINNDELNEVGTPTPLSPPPQPEIEGVWTYNFDGDTVDQWPAAPPWNLGSEPIGQTIVFGADDFEDDVLGENPDYPPWFTVDGNSIVGYWTEDMEGFTPSQDLTNGEIHGDQGYFGNFVGGATLTAEPAPAGGPPGTIIPGYTAGAISAQFIDPGGGSYWGPAGIGDTTTAYAGGWVYMNSVARFDFMCYDLAAGATMIEVAFQNDNLLYHWPGGAYTNIPGPTYAIGEWHELYVQYDEGPNTYSVWWDGVEYAAGSGMIAGGSNVDSMIWFGDIGVDAYVDNFFHFLPPAGLTHVVDVSDVNSNSGAQSIWFDQNGEAAPDLATMTATFDPPVAGIGSWDYWMITDTAAGDTDGAFAELTNQAGNPVIQLRANGGNFQYNDGGVWTDALVGYAPDMEYNFHVDFDTTTKTFTLDIDSVPAGAGAFLLEAGTISGVTYRGSDGTQSEHYIDDVNITCNGADANITVSNLVSNSAPNSLRFQEYNAIDFGYIGAEQLGTGMGAVGTYSFWFYNTDSIGGQTWELGDVNGGGQMNVISLGVNLATLESNPGVVQMVNNDGTGLWVVDGPTYNPNEWHQITLEFDCLNTSVSGTTGSYYYRWDGGALNGPYGMIDQITYFDYLACMGGSPGTNCYGDFFYDDFYIGVNGRPGGPTNCWAELPAATGVEVFANYSTDQDNPVYGIVTGDETDTHTVDGATEDIREVAINDVPTWANYTVDMDVPVEGVVTNDYTNVDEIFPPDGLTEDITEVIGAGGSTFIDYYTDLDIPVNGTVTGTEANTHGAGTQDIEEITNGGNFWFNYSTDQDIPVQGTVTGTHVLTQILDGSSQEILEVVASKKSPGPGPAPFAQIYYDDRAIFDGDAGPLPIEDFEEGNIGAGGVGGFDAPLDENSNNAYFIPGDILPGIRIQDLPGPDANGLAIAGAGFSGNPTITVCSNTFVDGLEMWFDDPAYPTHCIGMDLQSFFSACNPTLEIYGLGGVLLDTVTPPASNAGTFWGVISDEQIEHIHILDAANTDGGDNIAFGEGQWGDSLEHQWRTDPVRQNATTLTVVVNARTNVAPCDDNFTFEYSEDGIHWSPTGITVNSSVMTQYTGTALMLNSTAAPLYLRAKDTNNDDYTQRDTLFVDYIRVDYYNDRPLWHTLEHRWRTQSIFAGGDNLTLFVTAATNVGADDDFTFYYATAEAGPYTWTTLTVNSDTMTTYSVEIPVSLTGQIYLRVMDDNTWADPTQADTLIIDEIWVQRQVGMSLQHVWRTESVSADTLILELFIDARTNTGADDTFTFGYSTSQTGPFTPTPIVVNSDVMTTYQFVLPVLTGVFYLNVIDDNPVDHVLMDTLIIDILRLESTISGATITRQVATADNPDHGTVTGTFALTTSIPPDGAAQQIDEIALSKKNAPTPPTPLDVKPVEPRLNDISQSIDMISAPPTAVTSLVAVDDALDYTNNMQSLSFSTGSPLAPPPGPSTRAVLVTEDFSTPWVPDGDGDYDAPPGWDIDGICVGENAPFLTHYWSQFNDAETGFLCSNSTPDCAGAWWSNGAGEAHGTAQDEWIKTPILDLSGHMNTQLYFNMIYFFNNVAGEEIWLKVSGDGGMSWDNFGSLPHDFLIPGATGGWLGAGWNCYEMYDPTAVIPLPIDLSAYDFLPAVQVAWHIEYAGVGNRGIINLDDVHIDADAAGNSLGHSWTMEPQPADSTTRTLYVNARTDAATDEGFRFGWSQNPAGPFATVITVPGDADTLATYSASIQANLSGPLYINVIDDVGSDFDPVNESSVFIDAIWIFNDNTVQPLWEHEHRWRTEVIAVGSQTLDLHVTARTNTGADDTFTFGYATALGGPYTPVINVNSDVMTTYTAMLPYQLSGAIYLNVIDDLDEWAQPGHASSIDTIYIDGITIEYFSPGGTMIEEYVIRDRPGHGNVTGNFVMTQSNPPDGVEQEIEEIDPELYLPDTPASTGGPAPLGPGPGPQPKAQVYYDDRAVFDGDGGADLPIEDFEESTAAPGSINGMDAPLDENTNNAYFNPGDILPGIRIEDEVGPDANGLVAIGAGAFGCPTQSVSTNTFVDSCNLWFDDPLYPVFAVGLDLQTYIGEANIDINIYGLGGVLLDTTSAPGTNAGTFWGVISDEQIERINLDETAGACVECGDNIAFGIAKDKGYTLAHAWEMDCLPNMLTRTLHVNAHTNAGANDNFTFGYVSDYADLADDDAWIPLFNVTSDIPTDYSAQVPVNFNGEFYVIAWDTTVDDEPGPANADTLYVDSIYLQSFESAGSTAVTLHWDMSSDDYSGLWDNNYTVDQDNPEHGIVTGTFADVGFPPDAITEDIQEIPIGFGTLVNFTVDSDIDVEGARSGSYLDIDEIDPPDGNTEDITEQLVPGGSPTVIDEDFSTDPASRGWTITHTAGTAWTWSAVNLRMENTYGYPNSGYLDSPVLDCSGLTGVNLEFWHYWQADWAGGTQDGYVRGSTDGGASWPFLVDEFHHLDPAVEDAIKNYVIPWADGQSQVMLRYDIYNYDDWYWRIDDFLVTGTSAPQYSLEHKWTTEALDPTGSTLYVMARHNTGSDDTFSIEYSTNDTWYFPTGITINSDVLTTYTVILPPMGGSIYLRVVDDTIGDVAQGDTVFIELIRIEQMQGGDLITDFLTDQDIPQQGVVTGTHVLTQILDGSSQEILEVNPSAKSIPGPQPNAQVYYTDRATFDSDAGPLPIEDFEEGNIGAGGVAGFDAPLDENTNNAYFLPGEILPGIRIQDLPGPDAGGLAIAGPGFSGNPTITVCSNTFADSLDMWFDDPAYPTHCIGMDLQSYFSACTPTIEIYGVGGVLLDTVTAPASNAGTFWGIISDEQIEHINIFDAANTDGGDNIAFGEGQWGNSLEHRWSVEPIDPGASGLTLYVNARTNTGADDNFTFEYSEDGTTWNATGILVDTDLMTEYTFVLPLITGQMWLKVKDDNNNDYYQNDTIYIDELRVEYFFDVIPQNSLDHRWRTEVIDPAARELTLHVTARTNTGSDDSFTFLYNTVLGGPAAVYTPLGITVNSDVMLTYSVPLPLSLMGTAFYIQVLDDNELDVGSIDTLFVDSIQIEYKGYILGTGENDLIGYNIWRADAEDGDDITGPYELIETTLPFTDIFLDAGEGLDLVNQAWYYIEALDNTGQTNASGFFSKLNFAPETLNTQADGVTPRLYISPFTPTVEISADVFDDSSQFEAIPKMEYAEMFVDVDPGDFNGFPMANVDGVWDTANESINGTLDTSTWDVGVYEVYVRTAEDHSFGLGNWVMGDVDNVTIEVVDGPPIANAGPDQLVPQHTLVTFDGSLSTDDVGIDFYWWNFTDGGPQSLMGVAPSYTFDNEGVYTVTLTVMDRMGQTDSDTMDVNVTDGDPPVADAGPDQQVTPGDVVTFDGTASYDPGHLGEPIIDGIVNWTWTFDDGTGPQTLWDPTPTHQFDIPGVYMVTLTVTDAAPVPPSAAPYTDTDTMNVTVVEIFNIDITPAAGSDNWILVSFPNQVSGDPLVIVQDAIDEGLGLVTWDIIQTYNATTGEWLTTSTFKPPSLNTFNYVDNYMAFWIHITSYGDGNLTVTGALATSGEQAVIPLKAGWNLIGYPFPNTQEMFNTFGTLFSLDRDIEVYDPADPYRLRIADVWTEWHDPGGGYWVHVAFDEDMWMWNP